MTTKKLQNIVGVLKDWLVSIYLYHKGKDALPVFIIKDVDFVFLNSLRSFFVREQFIMLTEDDIKEGSDVFCLKLLHIKSHSTLFYGKDVLWKLNIQLSDLRSTLELEIRNKIIQLREGYLSQDKGRYFLHELLSGMDFIWEWVLWLKHPDLKIPDDRKAMLSLFDVAWSCNSQIFYYLIDDVMEDRKVPSFIQNVHHYLVEVCTKVNNHTV
jgi:hypothetical protein